MLVDVLHQTDLFLPPADPDDHYDLAVQFALARRGHICLHSVLIDHPPATHDGAPAVNSVAQLGVLTDIWPTVSVGAPVPFSTEPSEQPSSGATAVLRALKLAENGLDIHIVGSCRDVAEAALADPGLFERRCRRIYLNAGSSVRRDDLPLEYNVALDTLAYRRMFEIPCEIYWAPCFSVVGERVVSEYATHWDFDEQSFLDEVSPAVRNYLLYALADGASADWLAALRSPSPEPKTLGARRSMWSVAGFFHSAGLTVCADGSIATGGTATDELDGVFEFVPVHVDVADTGELDWTRAESATRVRLFRVRDLAAYPEAMRIAMRDTLETISAAF